MLNETFNNIPVEQETADKDTIVYTAGSNGKPLLALIKKEFDLNPIIMKIYWQDKIYSKILESPKAHAKFGVKEGLIFTKNNPSWDVICVSPKAIHKGKRLIKIIIDHAHNIIGHFGQFKTSQYIRRYFWWQSMWCDIELYCKTCSTCATSKFYHNIFCILFDIKDSVCFCVFGMMQDMCMCVCVWHLYLSVQKVTKHGGRSPSPTGINWVSDGVSIDSSGYMRHKSVCFSVSLEQVTVVDFWGRNRTIPVGTKLLLLSNRLQGFWWGRTILD